MASFLKHVYIGKSNDIVDNKYPRAIRIKTIDAKSSTYVDFDVENNDKNPKFEAGDHVKISKYKNIYFKRIYFFMIEKVKGTLPS